MFSDDFPMEMEREAGAMEHISPLAVGFGLYPVLDSGKTREAGHDVYKDVEFVKIAVPGDKSSLFFQPAREEHRRRFPKSYAAFKNREQSPTSGMPIENWAPINRSLALTLKSLHINTVEALAVVNDSLVDRLGTGGRELREKAKAWLTEAKEGAASLRLAAEKQALQDQLLAMQAQIAALQKNSADDDGAAARKPRRTPAHAE